MASFNLVVFLGEVIIVGAGFVGSFLAYLLAKSGISVTVFEEDKTIGFPQHCAGLISLSGLKRLGILPSVSSRGLIVNRIRNFRIHAEDKTLMTRITSTIVGVIDRPGLDMLIAEKAMGYGAVFKLGSRVKELRNNGVRFSGGVYNGDIIVDAEGARRILLRKFIGSDTPGSIPALQLEVKVDSVEDTNTADVYLNTPDFFSWVIPLDNSTARVGVASRYIANRYKFLKDLSKKHFMRFKIIKNFGGLVHVDGPCKRFTFGNAVAVGDAAGQTKPTTGGGVVFGGLSAAILAKVIEKNLEIGMPLEFYDRIWRRVFSSNIRFMMYARRMLYMVNPRVVLRVLLGFLPTSSVDVSSDFDFQLDFISRLFH